MKILIVDRVKLFQQIIASELDLNNIDYVCETQGEKAFRHLTKTNFDMLCIPLFLDDIDGLELCAKIRALKQYQHTPVVLMTANHTPEVMAKALKSGVTDIFDKKNSEGLINFILHFAQHENQLSGKVLYVEDSKSQRLLLTEILTKNGLSVTPVATGEEAWENFQKQDYDIVITDIILQGSMSGISLANYIRNMRDDKASTPILALSAFESSSRRIGLFSLGINDYIDKPIIEKELIARIKSTLERQQLMLKVKEAQLNAEQSNRAKSVFLTNISHDLRTPLHGIISFANFGIKRSDSAPKEKLLRYFSNIRLSADRLLALLDDLLDLSKLEAGKMEINKEKSSLWQLTHLCIAEQEAWLKEKNISIKWKTFDETTIIEFDVPKIARVISNLLSNAIKFMPDNKHITFSCIAQDFPLIENKTTVPALLFSIEDEGMGIPEDELSLIFDKFTQSSKNTSNYGGTGLGLAISKKIIEAHGGKIWAENITSGGMLFSFVLPVVIKT